MCLTVDFEKVKPMPITSFRVVKNGKKILCFIALSIPIPLSEKTIWVRLLYSNEVSAVKLKTTFFLVKNKF